MDNVFQGLAKSRLAIAAPRFSVGRVAGGSLAACLWLWTSAGALPAAAPAETTASSSAYRGALDSFNRQEYSRALTRLEHAPATDRTGYHDTAPDPLARPRKGRATPTPAPSAVPDATPGGGVTANQGGAATPSPSPAASPSTAFTEKYEAAYVKFLEKNYLDTLSLLDEADKIQPGQPQSVSLRFKSHYALAYLEYRRQNYPGALARLDEADQTQKNADSYNLRGLVFSKQHNYDQAEGMFHKAITTDPALWAAKFNYAELPFNRGNYTDARTRFEELFSQTDAAKQPREAELTQYKVFLTLLLEGKVESASTFMDHLNFSGATPARYFCNAALNFRAGTVDKAKNWIDDAKKEFPPQLVAIFIESFYRLGWMADPNAQSGAAVAQITPVPTPAVTTSGTLPTTVATATAAPSASPLGTVAALSTPIVLAAASPAPTPVPAVVLPGVTPRPIISAPPVAVVVATPAASPARNVALASATPRATLLPTPVAAPANPAASVASATVPPRSPAASPARSVALASATPTPVRTPALARATPAPTASKMITTDASAAQARKRSHRRLFVLFLLLCEIVYCASKMRSVLLKRKQRDLRSAAHRRALAQSSK